MFAGFSADLEDVVFLLRIQILQDYIRVLHLLCVICNFRDELFLGLSSVLLRVS